MALFIYGLYVCFILVVKCYGMWNEQECGASVNKHHRQLIFDLRWRDRLDDIYHARYSGVNGSARAERYRY